MTLSKENKAIIHDMLYQIGLKRFALEEILERMDVRTEDYEAAVKEFNEKA